MADAKTIAFFPEPGAWGPTNNCVAIANVLAERGHRIVFVVDGSFEGELQKRGFEERMMSMAPPEENADPTADPWAEFIRVTAPEFAKPTIEQIATVTKPIWETLVAGAQYSHARIMEIWDDIRPDVVCTDNVTGYPAVELAGCPWVRFVSANPLEMRDLDLPPSCQVCRSTIGASGRRSGTSTTPSTWSSFKSTTTSARRLAPAPARSTSSTPTRRGRTCTCSPKWPTIRVRGRSMQRGTG